MNERILIVEDDATIAEMLQFNLDIEGYQTMVVHSAEEALQIPLEGYDLILLDVMMGKMSGFELAHILKNRQDTAHIPVIFCTAKTSEDDMVHGLNIGADDYIYKPYTLRNVTTRVKAVLRRNRQTPIVHQLCVGNIVLDLDQKICTVDGQEVSLLKKEFNLLALLLAQPGHVFSREEIIHRVWDSDVNVLDRTVDVNVARLRQKIVPYGSCIQTRTGFGYSFITD